MWKRMVTVAASVTAAAVGAEAGIASGRVIANGKPHPMNNAYAVMAKDSSDDAKPYIKLLISEVPLAEDEVRNNTKLMRRYFDKNFTYLEFRITPGNTSSNFVLWSQDLEMNFSGSNSPSLFKPIKVTDSRIEGTVEMAEATMFKSKAAFSVKVAADIMKPAAAAPAPTAAETAAAVASEPGKAYLAYVQALRVGNKAALQKLLVAEMASKMSMPEAASQLKLIQAMMPQQIEVKKLVESRPGEVRLLVAGQEQSRVRKGEARMVKEAGMWKVAKDSWGDDW